MTKSPSKTTPNAEQQEAQDAHMKMPASSAASHQSEDMTATPSEEITLDSSARSEHTVERRMEKDPLGIGIPLPVSTRVRRVSNRQNVRRFDAPGNNPCNRDDWQAVAAAAAAVARANMAGGSFPPQKPVLLRGSRLQGGMDAIGAHAVVGPGARSTVDEDQEALDHMEQGGMDASIGAHAVVGPGSRSTVDEESVAVVSAAESSNSSTGDEEGSGFLSTNSLITATLVSLDDDRSELGGLVVHAKPMHWFQRSSLALWVLGALVIVCATIILVLIFALKDQGSDMAPLVGWIPGNTTAEPRLPTLEVVRARGLLHCGAVGALAMSFANNYVQNICGAMAAAVLGNASAFEIVRPPEESKFTMLGNGSIDVLMTRMGITMEMDLHEESVGEGMGLSFGVPYLYGGVGFIGDPAYVQCADDDIRNFGNCSGLEVCISKFSAFLQDLELRIPSRQIVVEHSNTPLAEAFMTGKCNVIAHESSTLMAASVRAIGFAGQIALGEREYSTEMWGMKTVDSDQEWHNFLDATVMALLAAEIANVTKADAYKMGKTDIFGKDHEDMFINAVGASGNFGELYDFPIPRDARNKVNDGSTGLLASPPLGRIEAMREGSGPISGGKLERVLNRGLLVCGVRGDRPGFASYNLDTGTWEGMDVDYCRALATALFDGDMDKVFFQYVNNTANGYSMLVDGHLDVLAGAVWTLQDDMKGFTFSQPYFYGPVDDSRFEENLCLVTHQEDTQWSSFVYWVAQSLVYAEEHGMSHATSHLMPLVGVFGTDLYRIFRDAIHAIGNYGECYERNLEAILPRSGRNRLNLMEEKKSPLRYIPPGFSVLDGLGSQK